MDQAETPPPVIGKRRELPPRERQWRSTPQVADPGLPRPDPHAKREAQKAAEEEQRGAQQRREHDEAAGGKGWPGGMRSIQSASLDCFATVEHLSISNAVRTATARSEPTKHLRIFASPTDVILPVIRDNRIHIDTCEVAIQWFDRNANDTKLQTFYAQCDSNISFWGTLKHTNYIKRIITVRYPFTPSHFVVIFDEKLLITGLYWPSESPTSAVDYIEPWLVDNSTESGQKLIEKYTKQFQELIRPLPKTELV